MKIIDLKENSEKQKISKYNLKDRPSDVAPLAGTSRLQGSKETFLEREYYKDLLFKSFTGQERNFVDSWNSMSPFGLSRVFRLLSICKKLEILTTAPFLF